MIAQIDIDATIDRAPEFFKWLTKSLRRDGHKVLIVSSRIDSPENEKHTAQELKEWGITYDKLVLHPDVPDLDTRRIPTDLHPAHRIYIYKVIAAEDLGTEILFDDCGITTSLFRKYLPNVQVFHFLK
jgi:hypothetical protein